MSDGPHRVDIHVGSKVKLFRNMAGVTQTGLADSLGLTFQQVQKYEKGTNRISSSKLFEISRVLGRDIAEFFDGLEEGASASTGSTLENMTDEIVDLISSREGLRLNKAFVRIENKALRNKVVALVEALVGYEPQDD